MDWPLHKYASATRTTDRASRAFTMLELLVVISILLLLVAMLIPSLNAARERVRRMACANNLRQWGIAVQAYRDDYNDYLPGEGSIGYPHEPSSWFNALPPYIDTAPYGDLKVDDGDIRTRPDIHVWICPSKNLSDAFTSKSRENQFHYGMNAVLDGLGSSYRPSHDAPDFVDPGEVLLAGRQFANEPNTVFMFDIHPNQPYGTPRNVATAFHKDYANVLYLAGGVRHFHRKDFRTAKVYYEGDVVWTHPLLYWGYRPPTQ